MKKLLIFVAVVAVLSLLWSCSFSESEEPIIFESGDYKYIVLEEGTAEITKYTGNEEVVEVPAVIDGYSITSIGDRAFQSCRSLSSITIPISVTSIGDYAFSFCENLTSITIPDSVTSIGVNPFLHSSYTTINAINVSPDHPVLAIIDGVLFNKADKSLICYPYAKTEDTYSIPNGINIIGNNAFSGNKSLTSIMIPDSVTSIGDSAFLSCRSLSSITIPDSVTSIGNYPFRECVSLTSIYVSPDNPVLATLDGVLFNKENKSLICYPCSKKEVNYSIPQGICLIGNNAFSSCENLTSITIPDSVTSIGDYAFSSCENLTSITIPDSVTSIGMDAFYKCSGQLMINVYRDSYAANYCKENGLNYTYPDSNDWLNN